MKKFINTIPTSFTILESLKKMDEIKDKIDKAKEEQKKKSDIITQFTKD